MTKEEREERMFKKRREAERARASKENYKTYKSAKRHVATSKMGIAYHTIMLIAEFVAGVAAWIYAVWFTWKAYIDDTAANGGIPMKPFWMYIGFGFAVGAAIFFALYVVSRGMRGKKIFDYKDQLFACKEYAKSFKALNDSKELTDEEKKEKELEEMKRQLQFVETDIAKANKKLASCKLLERFYYAVSWVLLVPAGYAMYKVLILFRNQYLAEKALGMESDVIVCVCLGIVAICLIAFAEKLIISFLRSASKRQARNQEIILDSLGDFEMQKKDLTDLIYGEKELTPEEKDAKIEEMQERFEELNKINSNQVDDNVDVDLDF